MGLNAGLAVNIGPSHHALFSPFSFSLLVLGCFKLDFTYEISWEETFAIIEGHITAICPPHSCFQKSASTVLGICLHRFGNSLFPFQLFSSKPPATVMSNFFWLGWHEVPKHSEVVSLKRLLGLCPHLGVWLKLFGRLILSWANKHRIF